MGKGFPVKSVMDSDHRRAAPARQFRREGFTRSHGHVRPMNRPLRQNRPEAQIQPGAIFVAGAQVSREFRRSVKRIARKQDLRHRRFSQGKISCGKQNICAALSDQFRQFRLFVPEPSGKRNLQLQEIDVFESLQLLPQTGAQRRSDAHLRIGCEVWNDVACVGETSAGTGGKRVDKQVHHRPGATAPTGCRAGLGYHRIARAETRAAGATSTRINARLQKNTHRL